MIAPIPVLYFVKGKQPRAMDLDTLTPGRLWPFARAQPCADKDAGRRIMELERSCEAFHEMAVGFALEAQPHVAPPPKRRGRPPGVRPPVEQPEPPIDQRGKVKALEACRDYLKRHPRGGYLARWFREGQQDLREAELQARARGDFGTADLAEQLLVIGRGRAEVRAALALPRDFGRVKPEGET